METKQAMEPVPVMIMTPETLSNEVESFAADNKTQTSIERTAEGAAQSRDLGFEPITSTAVVVWLAKFAAGAASSLLTKLIVDRLAKKMAPATGEAPVEIQIAFPNGNVVTIRGADRMNEAELKRLIDDSLNS